MKIEKRKLSKVKKDKLSKVKSSYPKPAKRRVN